MALNLEQWQNLLKDLSSLAGKYEPVLPMPFDGYPVALYGHSPARLIHTVFKTGDTPEFILDQAIYMEHLGPSVCPKVLAYNQDGYIMEYLYPAKMLASSIRDQEKFLADNVWCRPSIFCSDFLPEARRWYCVLIKSIDIVVPRWAFALEEPCLIHGDPTLDNMLLKDGQIRITDPIPPQYLNRPCLRSVDQGRLLQSFLGWETVLRGMPHISYMWPEFMCDYKTALRAIFWCMVVLKRISVKDTTNAGIWAGKIAEELQCELLS
jgi:hypothetical protein